MKAKPILVWFSLAVSCWSMPLASAATLTITNLNDSGAGSLRQAIADATPGDTINLSLIGTIVLTNGELLITNNLAIIGPRADQLGLSGNNSNRVFEISSNASVTISGLTIRDGRTSYASGSSDTATLGGGIYNAGTLTLSNCIVSANGTGRGGDTTMGNAGPGGDGGGIFNLGMLTLQGCHIVNNYCGAGGNFYASPFYGSGGLGGKGGGICNLGQLSLNDCMVSGNRGGDGGGNSAPGPSGAGGSGGGIYSSGTLTMNRCTINQNSGGQGGGPPGGFEGGTGGNGGDGGGVFNSAGQGSSGGVLTLTDCTMSGNSGGPGGIGAYVVGSGGDGGAIYNDTGTLSTLIASTISSNNAGAGGNGGNGGGIFNATNVLSTILRSTLIALNRAGLGGITPGTNGVGPDLYGGFISQGHNLVGQGDGSTGLTNGANADKVGIANMPLDPLLGPLQDNGGATVTMALLAGSPAIDAGDDALVATPFNLAIDQRGFARKSGSHVDIGAYELQQPSAPPYLARLTIIPGAGLQFTFTNAPGVGFTVLGTTNVSQPLAEWSVLGSCAEIVPGQFQFTDPQAVTNATRLYRVRSP